MKLAKLLVQSAPAAILFVALLALLLFYLNPERPLTLPLVGSAMGPLLLVPGLLVWFAWPLGLLAIRFFAERPLELDWFRFELFHRFHLANTALAAAIWWGNYLATAALLAAPAHRLMLAACGSITLVWCLGALLSLQRVMFRTPRPRLAQGILMLVLFGGLFGLRVGGGGDPGGATGSLRSGTVSSRGRIVLVGIEGLSPEFVLPLAAEGRLPVLGAILRDGARGRVQLAGPPVAAGAWTTVATGVLPRRHGIVDSMRWAFPSGRLQIRLAPRFLGFGLLARAGLVEPVRVSSADRREPALWNLLDAARLSSAVVGWWAATPADAVRTRFVGAELLAGVPDPPGLEERVNRLADWGEDPEGRRLRSEARQALREDLVALEQGQGLAGEEEPPTAILIYLPGLGRVQREFLGKAVPPALRWRPGPPDPAYGEVIARYHRLLDEAVGTLTGDGSPEPPLLVVISASGLRRPAPWALFLGRMAGWRWLGPHGRPPAGMLLVAGPGVSSGAELGDLAPEDLVPTAAYYLGLPVARDLEGRARTVLFDEAFISEHPLAYIPSYHRRVGR